MQSKNTFQLSGLGYLTEISRQNGQKTAKIKVIHQFSSGADHSDQIWLNCLVRDFKLQSKLGLVERSLGQGNTVIVQFDAKYIGLEHSQFGMTDEDPNQFIQFKADLFLIHSMYINGKNINVHTNDLTKIVKSALKIMLK